MNLRVLVFTSLALYVFGYLAIRGDQPRANSRSVLAGPITNAANGHIYFLLSADTWSNSQARAKAMGGHLAAVNNAQENAWLVNTFSGFDGVPRPLWIGFTDRRKEGDFRWVNGLPSRYTNWAPGEPNNSGGAPGEGGYEEDFTYIVEPDHGGSLVPGMWNDVPNDGAGVGLPMHGVVELRPARTPWFH